MAFFSFLENFLPSSGGMFNSKSNIIEETNGFRKIHIQDLERKTQKKSGAFDMNQIKPSLSIPWKTKDSDIYFYRDTGLKERTYHINNFIGSFICAYNLHGDIMLNPDDIWIMISLYFSQYVDTNAEKLRSKFVKHEGFKKLVVVEYANSLAESLKMERDWTNFFNQITQKIKDNTVTGVMEELVSDFTTTTKTHKLITTAIIMNSFKKYFQYGRMILGCGISNVLFQGTRNDWVKIINKTQVLAKYDLDGKLKKYLDSVCVILTEFLNTWDGKPNVAFWNKIMATEEKRIGSGGQKQTHIEGWILHFFGIYTRVDLDDVPDYSISVPVELYNEHSGTTKQLEIKANWVSASLIDPHTYKPDIGMCIIEAENKTEKPWLNKNDTDAYH